MPILKDFRNWIEKQFRGSPSVYLSDGERASPAPIINYQEAYTQIEIINRAITMIVNGVVSVPFLVDNKRWDRAINKEPNWHTNREDFYRKILLDYLLEGNAFILIAKPETGSIQLEHLPSKSVDIVAHPDNRISHYEYHRVVADAFGTTKQTETIAFQPDQIIHIKGDSWSNNLRGDSQLLCLDNLIKLYYQMIQFQTRWFQNNAIPGLVFESDNVLSPTIKARLLASWRENYGTLVKGGARSPAVLDGGLKLNAFSYKSFQEMDFEKSIERIQQDMCSALGVPYKLLQAGENNVQIDSLQKTFWYDTILPLARKFARAFEYASFTKVEVDTEAIPQLKEDIRALSQYATSLVNTGILTPDEARVLLRYEPLNTPETSKIRVPANIAGSAVNPAIGGREPDKEDSENE